MSFTRFASAENRAPILVFKQCIIEGIMSGYDKQLILTIFAAKGEEFCPFKDLQGPPPKFKDIPGFSRAIATLSLLI